MVSYALALSHCLLPISLGAAQRAGNTEHHPRLVVQKCGKTGNCVAEDSFLTLDAEYRNLRNASKGAKNACSRWDPDLGRAVWDEHLCPDPKTCAANCALDGVSLPGYARTYSIKPIDHGIQMGYVTKGGIGARMYVLDGEEGGKEKYKMFKLKNREFSFDVDVSTLPCGVNAALYFVEMDSAGGKSSSKDFAGAAYGTGYCDARCPRLLKFIDGEANIDGDIGSCCTEMDLFEANSRSMAFTAHPCEPWGATSCQGVDCGDSSKGELYKGVCDKDGCMFNPYQMGHHTFYGLDGIVNTKKNFTVVTQFITEDGTDDSGMIEIRRFYVQDGEVIQNAESFIPEVKGDSITDRFCGQQKFLFEDLRRQDNLEGEYNQFAPKGGTRQMGAALERGMVLALSIWDDAGDKMNWLDSTEPSFVPDTTAGVHRGECSTEEGDVDEVRKNNPHARVTFANLKYGPIGFTSHLLSRAHHDPPKSDGKTELGAVDMLTELFTVATPHTRRGWLQNTVVVSASLLGAVLIALFAIGRRRARIQITDGHTELARHVESEVENDTA